VRVGGEDAAHHLERFQGGLVFEAQRLLYHSTLGLRVIKKRRRDALFRLVAARTISGGGVGGGANAKPDSIENTVFIGKLSGKSLVYQVNSPLKIVNLRKIGFA